MDGDVELDTVWNVIPPEYGDGGSWGWHKLGASRSVEPAYGGLCWTRAGLAIQVGSHLMLRSALFTPGARDSEGQTKFLGPSR